MTNHVDQFGEDKHMKMIFLTLIITVVGVASPSLVTATTYFVDKSIGNNSNTGTTESTPFLTIQKCFNILIENNAPGDTCLVKNGTYTETVRLFAVQGTADAPITIKNYPGHSPVIDCSTNGQVNCFNVNPSYSGPASQKLSWVVVEGFEITGAYASGLKFTAADNLVVRRNYIHHNGGSTYGSGILGVSGKLVTIERNILRQNGNPITRPYGHGMYITGSQYLIINNIFDGNAGFGIQSRAKAFDPSRMPDETYANFQGLIANNTCAYQGAAGCVVLWSDTGKNFNVTISNNIFYQNRTGGPGGGVMFLGGPDTSTGHTVTRNVFFGSNSGGAMFNGIASCIDCVLAPNDTTMNPNMVNAPLTRPSSPDFHLKTGSVAIDFGLNLTANGVTKDFERTDRPVGNGFDIGAYEFGDAPPRPLE
jgi:hypothetical protein